MAKQNSEANEAAFTLALTDAMSDTANDAAKALENLRDKMEADTAEISQLNKVLRNLKAAGKGASDEVKRIKDELNTKRIAVAASQAAVVRLGGALQDTGKKAGSLTEIIGHARSMPGPVGTAARAFESLRSKVSGTTVAIVAAVAATALFIATTARALTSLTQYAVAQQNARRSELLRLEGLAKLRTYLTMGLGIGEANAKDVQKSVDRISASYATGRQQIVGYAQQLMSMGLRGKNLDSALEGMAIKSSTQGEAAAQMFAGWAQGLALTGGRVDKFTERVKNRLGGIAKQQMLDANVQAEKLQESFSMLTNGIDIEPLLQARKNFNDLFSQSTASGRHLQELLGKLVQPLVDATVIAFRVMKAFFQDLIILELQLEIAYYDLKNAIVEAFQKKDAEGFFEAITSGTGLLATVVAVAFATVIVPAIWTAVTALGAMAAAALTAMAPFILAGLTALAVMAGIGLAIWGVIKIVELLYTVWKEIDWIDLGRSIIDGIVGGIKAGWKLVSSAVSGVATAAVKTFKSILGIASPSKVFEGFGFDISMGVVQGVKRGQPAAQAAASKVVQPPPSIAPRVPPSASSGEAAQVGRQAARGGGGTISIAQLIVQASGAGDNAKQLAADIKSELERLLEGVALEMGAA